MGGRQKNVQLCSMSAWTERTEVSAASPRLTTHRPGQLLFGVITSRKTIPHKAMGRCPITTAVGDKISLLPDYIQAVSRQRSAFTEVRALLRNYEQVRYGLLFPATLRITTPNEIEVHFKDPGQAKDFIVKNLSPRVD